MRTDDSRILLEATEKFEPFDKTYDSESENPFVGNMEYVTRVGGVFGKLMKLLNFLKPFIITLIT